MPEPSIAPEVKHQRLLELDSAQLVSQTNSCDDFPRKTSNFPEEYKSTPNTFSNLNADKIQNNANQSINQKNGNIFRHRRAWGEIFRKEFDVTWQHQILEPVLGCLKKNKYPIEIHRLEKDLVYLCAKSINKRRQLFISFPISPVSLGILLIVYYAHLSREEKDIYHTHHAINPRNFVIWIRPNDNGQISTLRTTKAVNLVDAQDTHYYLSERVICLPTSKFDEFSKTKRLRVVMVRSLSEAVELFKNTSYCSLVVLDDASGQTYLSSSSYGRKAFELAKLCSNKQIPLVGIVPPWTMKDIEEQEKNEIASVNFWPVDFLALRSYPQERFFAHSHTKNLHPIEESSLRLERKRQSLKEAQVTIRTFNFDTEDEEKIAELFRESSDLLLDLAKSPQFRGVWANGWAIWRDLSAPVLPIYLLWEQFLEGALKRLEQAASRCGDAKALTVSSLLHSLAKRMKKLNRNPFLEFLEEAGKETIIAVEKANRANALEEFLQERSNALEYLTVLPISELEGKGGERLLVIGQPKARHRDLLQTTFFKKIDVLLWSVLAERAERWWSNLEVDAREWHRNTWIALTGKEQIGCYGYSPEYTSVQVIHTNKAKLYKGIDLSRLEARFSTLSDTSLDSGLTNHTSRNLESHYLVEFEGGLKIRVAPNSEFLVLLRKQTQVVTVRELTVGTKAILFEGMTRNELFAQKAGLLDDTKVNLSYHALLAGWRNLVEQQIKHLGLQTVSERLGMDTDLSIGEQTISSNWLNGDDLLSLPRKKEHFFWFIPKEAHSGFDDFWERANELRNKRRQLGRVISACAEEGWKDRRPDEIVFRYQQVVITVGELQDAMQILKVQSSPKLIQQPPEYPFNLLFS